jgi:hypothetical protein
MLGQFLRRFFIKYLAPIATAGVMALYRGETNEDHHRHGDRSEDRTDPDQGASFRLLIAKFLSLLRDKFIAR